MFKKNEIFCGLIFLALALILGGCGASGGSSATETEIPPAQTEPDSTVVPAPSIQSPTNLSVSRTAAQANLQWDANIEDDISGYQIYRSQTDNAADFVSLGTADGTSYTDNSIISTDGYYYAVSAYDADGNESGLSESVYLAPYSSNIPIIISSVKGK